MERSIITIVLASLMATATAQQTPTPSTSSQLATERSDWMALDITQAQLDEVMDLHTACVTDCTIEKGSSRELVPVPSVLKEYEDEVRKVLGEEKYQRWLKWCGTRPIKG
jgi:hypothetical protein